MLTKPFNEHLLWKGTIQRNFKRSLLQPEMVLPKIRQNHGGTHPTNERIHDEINKLYSDYSAAYWQGVKERAAAYRLQHKRHLEALYEIRVLPKDTIQSS